MAPLQQPIFVGKVLGLALSLVCAPALLIGRPVHSPGGSALQQLSANALAQTSQRYQSSPTAQQDFDEDAGLEQPENIRTALFQAVYINRAGNLLGTFVNVPGGKIKVYASGQIEIEARDYTTEVTYYNNGRLRTVGNSRLTYFNDGRIRSIGRISFSYYGNGRLRTLGGLRFDYFNNGRLRDIDNVFFEYSSDGVIKRISTSQTNSGIRVIVVD
ncbi:hypothetical protein [Pseudanabaena sp. FACHB-2040]|uniref:hypothetical protein n=1 Tax=Pseudanabaena sp. FACHB-2040 TaxID=2692859 RepID=UPI001685FAC7|nr:hypothetical protein [Pseudanabaena sp. FACHB-2040]MBD2259467.1 hypothetical protein [Pseudanabaena sp. FACHB-2040]